MFPWQPQPFRRATIYLWYLSHKPGNYTLLDGRRKHQGTSKLKRAIWPREKSKVERLCELVIRWGHCMWLCVIVFLTNIFTFIHAGNLGNALPIERRPENPPSPHSLNLCSSFLLPAERCSLILPCWASCAPPIHRPTPLITGHSTCTCWSCWCWESCPAAPDCHQWPNTRLSWMGTWWLEVCSQCTRKARGQRTAAWSIRKEGSRGWKPCSWHSMRSTPAIASFLGFSSELTSWTPARRTLTLWSSLWISCGPRSLRCKTQASSALMGPGPSRTRSRWPSLGSLEGPTVTFPFR